jgi:DNA-directed RNA polymerase subunit RPC12/RpoP
MKRMLFFWRDPELFVVIRCVSCRDDVSVRFPESWRRCRRCGHRVTVTNERKSAFSDCAQS